mgnify:CR=1 FL=1
MDPLKRSVTDRSLDALIKCIEMLRVLDVEMPAQTVAVFLYIASHDGCHSQAVQEDLGITAASVSRNSMWLSGQHRSNPARGLNLITKESDPYNRRRNVFYLTREGKQLSKQLSDILNG